MTDTIVRPGDEPLLDQHGQPVTGCGPCDNGCECEVGSPGCEHYGCWGDMSDEVEGSCPSAAVHRVARLARQR